MDGSGSAMYRCRPHAEVHVAGQSSFPVVREYPPGTGSISSIGSPHADVEELPDALTSEVTDRAAEELPLTCARSKVRFCTLEIFWLL
jgi:hypothetical protein